jgi:AraC-like DNA-binding protein
MSAHHPYTQPIEGLLRYETIDELNAVARGSGAEALQLQPGSLRSVYRTASLGRIHFSVSAFSGPVLFRGSAPPDTCLIGASAGHSGMPPGARGRDATELRFIPPGRAFTSFLAPTTRHVAIAVDLRTLEEAVELQAGSRGFGVLQARCFRARNVQARERLVRTLAALAVQAARHVGPSRPTTTSARSIEAATIEALMLETFPDGSPGADPDRHRIARRAADLMHEAPQAEWSLLDIARELRTTLRTLETGFREVMGVTPRQYRHVVRLHRARADLRRPSDTDTVSCIAMRYGLLHLGRFSVDYRTMFGESPSQTLREARGENSPEAGERAA